MKQSIISGITKDKRRWVALPATLVLWLAMVSLVLAASPAMVNIGVANTGKMITIDARLVDGFTESMLEAIESGVPLSFTFEIELRKDNDVFPDTLIDSNTIRHMVRYDSLKKVYRFSETGKNLKRKISTRREARFKELMLTLKNIPIAPAYHLEPNETYYIRVKAVLETDRFWFPFNYLFFFVPFNDFKTSWAQSSPLYLDPQLEALTTTKNAGQDGNPEVLKNVIRSFNN